MLAYGQLDEVDDILIPGPGIVVEEGGPVVTELPREAIETSDGLAVGGAAVERPAGLPTIGDPKRSEKAHVALPVLEPDLGPASLIEHTEGSSHEQGRVIARGWIRPPGDRRDSPNVDSPLFVGEEAHGQTPVSVSSAMIGLVRHGRTAEPRWPTPIL